MKRTALDALKTKFEGVSEAVLSRIADKIAKTAKTTEEVTTAVEGVTIQQVVDGYADSRANEAQQTAVANYEKKHGLKDGKPLEHQEPNQQEPNPTPKGGDDLAAQITAAVQAAVKPLSDELAALKGEKTVNARKEALNKILEGAPEKVRQRYEKDFGRMNFTDDEDFNNWIGEITPDVEAITTEFNAKGGVVGRPKGGAPAGGGKGDENPILKQRIAEREAATVTPAIQGLQ